MKQILLITLALILLISSSAAIDVNVTISQSGDDAEEHVHNGYTDIVSSDLEMALDAYNQTIGLRFQGITIPQGATIDYAYVEFEVDEVSTASTNLTIYGEDVDDAAIFCCNTEYVYGISSRTKTSASVTWNSVESWPTADIKHQTPVITTIIQEIVDRGGWASGNNLSIIITGDGTGKRVAESYDGESAGAASINIAYTVGDQITITSYAPSTPNSTYEHVNSAYNITISESANTEWLVDTVRQEWDNASSTAAYDTSSLAVGVRNITAIAHNVTTHSISDSQTWTTTVLHNTFDSLATYYDRDNASYNIIFEVSNMTAGLQSWNVTWNQTDNGNTSSFRYINGTLILNQSAISENQTLWFNSSTLLPEGEYYISEAETAEGDSEVIISCSGWSYIAMNSSSQTLGEIDSNYSYDVVQAGYNSTSQRYQIHRPGRALNANYDVAQRFGYTMYFSSVTNVYVTIPETIPAINLLTGWNLVGHLSNTSTTITDMLTDIGANATQGCYGNVCTGGTTVPAGEAIMVYITDPTLWAGS